MPAMPFPGLAPWTQRVGPPDHLCFADGPPVDEPGRGRRHGKGRRLPAPARHAPALPRTARRGAGPGAATSAPPPCSCWPRSRATATRSCRPSRSAPAAPGAPARAASTRRSPSCRTRASSRVEERDGGRTFRLTEAGTAHVEERRADLERRWRGVEDAVDEGVPRAHERGCASSHFAAGQLLTSARREQVAEARRVARASPAARLPDARGRRAREGPTGEA